MCVCVCVDREASRKGESTGRQLSSLFPPPPYPPQVQRLTRETSDLRDELAACQAARSAAEDALADAAADKLDAIASEQAASEAALLAARAEVDGALARAADAIRDRDAALMLKHAAEKRAERLATAAHAATEKARGLQRELHRATLASAAIETLTEGEVEALVGAACDGADARARSRPRPSSWPPPRAPTAP